MLRYKSFSVAACVQFLIEVVYLFYFAAPPKVFVYLVDEHLITMSREFQFTFFTKSRTYSIGIMER